MASSEQKVGSGGQESIKEVRRVFRRSGEYSGGQESIQEVKRVFRRPGEYSGGQESNLARRGDVYKAVNVNIYKGGHQELAIKPKDGHIKYLATAAVLAFAPPASSPAPPHLISQPIHNPPVSRDDITKVLNLEGSLEPRGKEPSERS